MESGFFNDEVKTRKTRPKRGRFVLAGIILLLSLLVAKEKKAGKESAE
jgi:hypothetical protein